MSESYTVNDILNAIAQASKTLTSRKEEINRLNVFPVPDGDTGTNMSLTIESVLKNLRKLPETADGAAYRKAITTGALMGARGNSGVITSQILRGFCEGTENAEEVNVESIDMAFTRAVEVAFQAVRKPVEGTILTVLRDTANAAKHARKRKLDTNEALEYIVKEAYASVERTPELLPVLKENNVVDAGGYGLAIFLDAFVAALTGEKRQGDDVAFTREHEPKVEIEHINDWEGSRFRYCTEFLVHSDTIDVDAAKEFLPTMGDCDLMVGMHPNFKVHVHSNRPDQVLQYFLTHEAQVSEVYIHNMQLQSEDRNEKLAAERSEDEEPSQPSGEHKPFGIVAVAAGEGNARILKSLGIDVVVSGGQTMNPSTKDLLDAAAKINADNIIILPDNSNIIMAAQSAASLLEVPCGVVPTKSVPAAFSAMFGFNPEATLEENVEAMTEAFADTKTGEVTWAIKDSKDAHDSPIKEGDVIGIADGSIEAVGQTVEDVVMGLLEAMEAQDADTLTVLAGADYSDEALNALVERVQEAYDELEIDAHRGDQPLYPIVMSVE